ncbi:hypothetical protein HELRODRAFT_178041 [Helobdella robusta]|uniref:Uncharacterized protein n=1 Tax=Helobdella robusta TaxID=6412 RepID=T1FCN6_HELRO|nr:hypothetical protein HELRODRAFT_178041 [Helobdella robusta]ESN97605.1 hypothetical protein HELRODRAFT_178041 [Helobdella robusta]
MENLEYFSIPGYRKQMKIIGRDEINQQVSHFQEIEARDTSFLNQQSEQLPNGRISQDKVHLEADDNKTDNIHIDNAIIYQNLTTSMVRFILRNHGKLPYLDYIQGNNIQYLFSMFPSADRFSHQFYRKGKMLARVSFSSSAFHDNRKLEVRCFLLTSENLHVVGYPSYNPNYTRLYSQFLASGTMKKNCNRKLSSSSYDDVSMNFKSTDGDGYENYEKKANMRIHGADNLPVRNLNKTNTADQLSNSSGDDVACDDVACDDVACDDVSHYLNGSYTIRKGKSEVTYKAKNLWSKENKCIS